MKKYHKILLDMGWELLWEFKPLSQYSNKKLYMRICEKDDGYHEVAVCPIKNFDRWANSRHINFRIMSKNKAWTYDNIEKDFRRNVKDAIWLCRTLKPEMFDRGVKINL